MEAVPRMPMIALELKHSLEYVDFGPTLKQVGIFDLHRRPMIESVHLFQYIRDHYSEDPANYNKACNELEQLRQSAIHVSHDFMGCSTLKKYFAQLQFLQGRFPMTEGGEAAIPFTWEDVHSGREVTLEDIKFEQACVLYNIGSLHSVLGAMDTRQSADGMKVSCTHFQCASWAFEHLRDHFGCAAMSLDMSHEVLTFQVSLMLAQAQECILEKSMTDSRKSTITAKVAAQIVEFYKTTLKNLDTCHSEELISSRRYKDWKKRIDIKVLFYTCITHYYMGRQSEDQQKWGQCLAYYTLSQEKLNECQKLAKGESQDIQESLRFTNDVVGGKYQAAKKDNDFVYHEKVPATDSLPEVKGASLVKGIPFNPNDAEISGPDIFQKLVPMSAHEASSLYSEEKASLLRRVVSEITEKNEELQKYMDSLQLDPSQLNPEQERLPQQLLEKCAALSVRPNAIKDLVDSMGAVSNVATDVDMGLKEVQQLLEDETKNEEEFQNTFGKRSPNVILGEIAKEVQMFEEGHKKGSQSNNDLHKAMNTHINNLKLLSSPLEDLQKLLPSLDKAQEPENADVIKELNMLLSKVEEMKTQRTSLEEQLRKDIHEDDITNVLVTREGVNREVLFSEQLKKHEKTTGLIRQNLAAQGNILRALTDANARYASVRRLMSETIAKRDQTVRDLINSYDVYEDLMAKSQKGLEFYKKLETNVGRLLARCRGVCKVQQEEREQITNRYKPKAPPPARPAAAKPSPSDPAVPTPPPSAQPHQTLPTMFEGPKLKDYLPFMKPKTLGKKDGEAPPDILMDPTVAAYMSRSGSLPNSGTASPVQISASGSLPASPDHVRFRSDGPDRLRQIAQGPQIQYPDLKGPTNQGQGPADMSFSQRLPQGQHGPMDVSATASQGQGQIPQGQVSDGPTGPKMRRNFNEVSSQSTFLTSGQNIGQEYNYSGQIQGQGQGQLTTQAGSTDQYVPLNQKWKQEGQGSQMPSAGPILPASSSLRQIDRQIPASVRGPVLTQPSSSPAHSLSSTQGVQSFSFYTQPGNVQGYPVHSEQGLVNPQSLTSGSGHSSSQLSATQGVPQQPVPKIPGSQVPIQPASHYQAQQLQPGSQPPQQYQTIPQQYSQQAQMPSQQIPQLQQPSQLTTQLQQPPQTVQPQQIQPASQQPAPVPAQQVLPTSQQLPQQQQQTSHQQYPGVTQQIAQGQQQITAQQQQLLPQNLQSVPQPQQGIPNQHVMPQQQIQQQTHPAAVSGIPQQQQQQGIPQHYQQQGAPKQQPVIPQQQQPGMQPNLQQQTIQQPQQNQYIQPGSQQQQVFSQQQQVSPQHQQGIPAQQHQSPQHLQPVSHQQQAIPQPRLPVSQVAPQMPISGSLTHGPGQQVPAFGGTQQVVERGITNTVETVRTPVISPGDKTVSIAHSHTPQVQSQNQPGFLPAGNLPHQPTMPEVHGQVIGSQQTSIQTVQGHMPVQGQIPTQTQPPAQYQLQTGSQIPVQGQVPGQGHMPPSQVQGHVSLPQDQIIQQAQPHPSQGHFQVPQSQITGQGPVSAVQFQTPSQAIQNTGQVQGQTVQQPGVVQPQQLQGYQHIPQTGGLQSYQQQIGQSQQYQAPGQQVQTVQAPGHQAFRQAGQSAQTIQTPGQQTYAAQIPGQPGQIVQAPNPSSHMIQNQATATGSQFPAGTFQQPLPGSQPVQQQSMKATDQNIEQRAHSQWQSQGYTQNQGQSQIQMPHQGQGQTPSQAQGHISSVSGTIQGQGQVQGQWSSQQSNIQASGQMINQGQSQNQAQLQNQPPRSPAPSYSQTGLNRLHTQQIMSQTSIQTHLPVQPQTTQQGQGQLPMQGPQQQYSQGQQVLGSSGQGQGIQASVQGQQMYSQQRGQPGFNQAPQNQQFVQHGFQGQLQGQFQGQGHINQMESALLPSPLQPQPLTPTVVKTDSQDAIQPSPVHGQVQGQRQEQQVPQSNVPAQKQAQSAHEPETPYIDSNNKQGSQQTQNVPAWTPLNLNAAQEPTASGRATYSGQEEVSPGPATPSVQITGDAYKSPLSSVKSTPTHSRENSQGHLPAPSSVAEPLPTVRQLSTTSSLDEILSSSPDGQSDKQTDNVLAPKVLTAQEIQQQKEDLMKDSSLKYQPLDPYKDKTKLDKFVKEVEKLAKFIEGFEKPSCSGPTPLDLVWKELMEEQDKAVRAQSLAIARCYPMKNREQDIMPYDNSRVLLTSLSDDYINASWVNDLSPSCPKFITTQSPLSVTLVDFWCMIHEQGVEVLVTLSSENEVGKKFPVYWPEEKGKTVHHGSVHVTLQSKKEKPFWTERILHLTHSETRSGRTLVHLHYNAWPVSGFPDKVSHVLQFITEVHSFYRQQRSLMKPVVVHCSNGIGRSGTFILIYVGMQNINYGNGIINLPAIGGKMLWKRRNLLLKKDQLKYCYEGVLYYAQDILAKQGILVHKASFGDRLPAPGEKTHSWEPTEDILFGSMSLSSLQSNVEKFGIKSSSSGGKSDSSEKTGSKSDSSLKSSETDISNKLDEKLQKLKEESERIESEKLVPTDTDLPKHTDSFNPANLPDVVQRPSDSLEHSINKAMEGLDSEKLNIDILGEFGSPKKSVPVKDTEKKGSVSSLTSLGSDHSDTGIVSTTDKMKSLSLGGSPLHLSREGSESPRAGKQIQPVSSSLADLQDPSKFTIGTSPKGKRKITKTDFLSGESTLNKQDEDAGDPLSSLDPLWSLK